MYLNLILIGFIIGGVVKLKSYKKQLEHESQVRKSINEFSRKADNSNLTKRELLEEYTKVRLFMDEGRAKYE